MACENCGMSHAPEDTASCIEGHGPDPAAGLDAALGAATPDGEGEGN